MKISQWILSVLSLLVIVVLLCCYSRHKKAAGPRGKESVYAGIWWLCIFTLGFCLQLTYFLDIAIKSADSDFIDYLIAIALSLAATIRMFGFDFKTDAIAGINDGTFLGVLYAITLIALYFCAGLWTYLMLIKTFFRGASNSLRVVLTARPLLWRKKRTLYIVIGSGKSTETFVNTIDGKKDVIIITGQPNGDKKVAETAYKSFLEKGYNVICGAVSDQTLKRAGYTHAKRKVVVIAMSDDDEENVFAAELITCEVYNRIFCQKIDMSDKAASDMLMFRQNAITASHYSDDMTLEKMTKLPREKASRQLEILRTKFYALMMAKKKKIVFDSIEPKQGEGDEVVFEYYAKTPGKKGQRKVRKGRLERNPKQHDKAQARFLPQKTEHDGDEYVVRTGLQVLEDRLAEAIEDIKLDGRIMYSVIERAEHFAFARNAYGKVRFFNPYELRVRDFFWQNPITSLVSDFIAKKDETNPCYLGRLKGDFDSELRLVKKDGKRYDIKNIFVGFGSCNLHMLKGSIQSGQLLGVDYSAVVFDHDVAGFDGTDSLKDLLKEKLSPNQARFVNHSYGLFKGCDECDEGKTYFSSPKESYNIRFVKADVLSRAFYNLLLDQLRDADFASIFIALGDDKLAIETALEIRQSLMENSIGSKKVKIFVKTRRSSSFSNKATIGQSGDGATIVCYGMDENTLTFDQIVAESFDSLTIAITNKNHGIPWAFLGETRRELNRQAALAVRTKLQLLGLDIVKSDQLPKSYNSHECWRLFKQRYGIDEVQNPQTIAVVDHALDKSKKILYPYPHKNDEIADNARNNLARLEHLRWNTFYLLNGWTKLPIEAISENPHGSHKNDTTKQHACITTFEDLIKLRDLLAQQARTRATLNQTEEQNTAQTSQTASKNTAAKCQTFTPAELGKYDTIWYDFSLMDELVRSRKRAGKMSPIPPRIQNAPFAIIDSKR